MLIERTFGCARYVYNYFLAERIELWRLKKEGTTFFQQNKRLTLLKQENEWLREPDKHALQNALRNLDDAYRRFFKGAGYPKFKSKHSNRQSYSTAFNKGVTVIVGNHIKLPKLGYVKCRISKDVDGRIVSATVSRTPSGKYYVSITWDATPDPMPNNGGKIGIDVGLKEFYTDSNGNIVHNPRFLARSTRKLAREHRRLSRKKKGSSNHEKQRVRVAIAHERVTNQRRDFLQKESTRLIRENQTICIEDLSVRNMVRNRRLSKAIADVSWSEFFRMLEYKAVWRGNDVIRVPAMYPSTQTCSHCGGRNKALRNLSIRKWTCKECGVEHDRDLNAATNILSRGLLQETSTSTVGHMGINACGDRVRLKPFGNAVVVETRISAL